MGFASLIYGTSPPSLFHLFSSFLPPPLSSHFSLKLVKPRGSKEALISTASGKTASSQRLSWWQATLLRRCLPLSRCVKLPPGRPVYNLRGTSCTTTTITGWASPFPTSRQSTTSCMRQVTRDPMSRICRWVGSSLHILEEAICKMALHVIQGSDLLLLPRSLFLCISFFLFCASVCLLTCTGKKINVPLGNVLTNYTLSGPGNL